MTTRHALLCSLILTLSTTTGCLFRDPCDDLLDDSRAEAAQCHRGAWKPMSTYADATGAYSVQWVDHDFYDPTDGWFDTCEDEAWSRDLIVIEHASGDPELPSPEDRVVYHLRRRCEWNIRCLASDELITDRVEFERGLSPIPDLSIDCSR